MENALSRSISLLTSVIFYILCSGAQVAWSADTSTYVNEGAGIAVFKRSAPSVVLVRSTSQSFTTQGSGVAFRHGFDKTRKANQTWVVTNAHVVSGSQAVTIAIGTQTYKATVKYIDEDLDIALLNIPDTAIPIVETANASETSIADRVYAIGSPLGLENSISEGIISGLREFKSAKVVQTTAAISKGNSGGGLFDTKGRLIGITTFKLNNGESLNFAIDAEYIKLVMDAHTTTGLLLILSETFADIPEWKNNPSNLTRWLMTTKASDGSLMHQYFRRKENEALRMGGDDMLPMLQKAFNEIFNQYKNDPRNRTTSQNAPSPVKQTDTGGESGYRLSCSMHTIDDGRFQFDLVLYISPAESKVNGRIATFTSGTIIFNLGGSGKHQVSLDRYSGIATTGTKEEPNIMRGSCTKSDVKRF